jgi:hypothetical protein
MSFLITITRRTFEAAKHPKGSPERARLNLDAVTSEYMPSYRYELKMTGAVNGSRSFRTKREAEAYAREKGCNL